MEQTHEGRAAARERAVGSYLPIVLSGKPLGVVAVLYPAGANSMSEEQRRLLNAFVAQTALAVGRAKLAEEEEKARAAAESERMKSTFLASVSHDLRTPLTAIKAAADGLWQDADARADPPHRELAASIGQEVGRLDRLVGNLLEISRIEAGGLPFTIALEDLCGIVGSVVSRLTPLLAGHHLAVEIPDDFPLVPVDAVEFDRVLMNLLENAAKFSPENSQISIELRAGSLNASVRVHNAGRPLLPDERVQIFEKFVRRESRQGSSPGVGLGLAICKGIVEAHGGDIFAGMNGPRVLIVDDEPEIRRALRVGLGDRGYRAVAVESGEEALASVEQSRPEVVLLDLAMPGIGGLETCRRIRARWAIPIIVLSVMGEERDKVAALDAGADDYLTKPFRMEELPARIRVSLRHAAALTSGTDPVYHSGELTIDLGKRLVTLSGADIHLTPTEYEVLKYLATHAGRVVTHAMVLRACWGPEYGNETQLLRYTILQLRKKLHDDPVHPRFLFTDPGIGYRFQIDP